MHVSSNSNHWHTPAGLFKQVAYIQENLQDSLREKGFEGLTVTPELHFTLRLKGSERLNKLQESLNSIPGFNNRKIYTFQARSEIEINSKIPPMLIPYRITNDAGKCLEEAIPNYFTLNGLEDFKPFKTRQKPLEAWQY